jgi:glycogen synthase
VQEYDEISNTGYGFFFYDATPNAFLDSVRQSIDIFQKQELWKSMVARALLTSFAPRNFRKCHGHEFPKLFCSL